MALPYIGGIAPETFEQANPFIAGYAAGQQLMGTAQQQQYNQYINQMLAQQVPYAGPQAAAQLAYSRAQTPYLQAQTGSVNANTALTQGITPGVIAQSGGLAFTDPMQQRAYELGLAARNPAMQNALSAAGINPQAITGQVPQGQQAQQSPQQGDQFTSPSLSGIPRQATNAVNNGALPSAGIYPPGVAQVPGAQQNAQQGYLPVPNVTTGNTGAPSPIMQNAPPSQVAPQAYSGTPAQNYALFGTLLNPFQMSAMKAAMEKQAETSVSTYNDLQNEASKEAQNANTLSNVADQFKENYDKSLYKGSTLGNIPVRGKEALLTPGNLSPEQETDSAATNLGALVAKSYFPGRVTNADMQYVQTMKPGRNMDSGSAQDLVQSIKAISQRVQEYPQFLNAAKQQGVDPQTAQTLWNNYIQQRPVFDYQNHQVRKSFQGSYTDFMNSQAINAAQNGQTYVPKPKFDSKAQAQSWYAGLTPPQQQYVTMAYGGKS